MVMLLVAAMLGNVTSNGTFEFDPVPHATGSLAALLVVGLAEVTVKPAMLGAQACKLDSTGSHCDASALWALDRTVVGNHSAAWGRISDAGMIAAVLLPIGASLADHGLTGTTRMWHDAGMDILVGVESIVVATFINTTLKFAVRRPRPALYMRGGTRIEQYLSFPSGHTAATAAGLAGYVTTFFLRHPDNPWRYAVLGAGAAVLGVTGYGRAADGKHFYSDIFAGAVLGVGVGVAVPYLLRHRITVQPWVHTGVDSPELQYYGLQLGWQSG